jgi:hypothetical protein
LYLLAYISCFSTDFLTKQAAFKKASIQSLPLQLVFRTQPHKHASLLSAEVERFMEEATNRKPI